MELGAEPDPAPVNTGATLPQQTPHPALRATFPSRGRQEEKVSRLFGKWDLQPNRSGFTSLEVNENELILTTNAHRFVFPYSLEVPAKTRDPKYQQTIYTQGFPQKDGSLYLYAQILDEYVGSMHFVLNVKDSKPTLYIRKIEETCFGEFNGFFEGV